MDFAKKIRAGMARVAMLATSASYLKSDWYQPHQLHIPERLPGETWDQYKLRRKRSQTRNRELIVGPRQEPARNALDHARFWLGQHRASGTKTPSKTARRHDQRDINKFIQTHRGN